LKCELVENRLIVWNLSDSKKLFTNGYYGKPIGISKPKPNEINVPLILDLIEGYYLMLKSKIQIFKNKKRVTEKKMLKICQEQHHNFDKKFQVYNDFRQKGYIVNPGIKFGCDFAVYQRGPGIDHAPFLVQVYNRNENISSNGVVLAGRLATSVKKQFILAIPSRKNKIDYIALDWWKA
jgi:tRNA-intron endonuclease|tara:strand:- start:889 stop:1425 length:537 start_codon:yes stop_codon:yes gene_type:complete